VWSGKALVAAPASKRQEELPDTAEYWQAAQHQATDCNVLEGQLDTAVCSPEAQTGQASARLVALVMHPAYRLYRQVTGQVSKQPAEEPELQLQRLPT
jgi:antitoxin (DNA-binding transcriptional repressor) of toxin-antitoxin stability system